MGTLGKSPIETLKNFRSRKWFNEDFKKFALRVATEYSSRNEVFKGCTISKGSGTTDADQMNLAVVAGDVKLAGVLMSVAAVANKEAVKGVSASLEIAVSGVPTISANSNTHETLTVSSGGVSCVVRFYDSSAASPTGYDTTGSFADQIDIDLNGLNAAGVALRLQTALSNTFGSSYTVGSGTTFTITAPIGDGFDFTYEEEQGLGNLAGTATDYSYSFGGLITSTGSAQTEALTANSVDYMITFIASNSNGTGGANSDDGDVAIIHGIISSSDSAHLSSLEINAALAGSSGNVGNYDHSGVTGWAHVAQVAFSSSDITVTMNRNNAVSKA